MTADSYIAQDQKVLLGLCHKKNAKFVEETEGLTVISTENDKVIGIINEDADLDDPLEMLSSAHEKLIELARHFEVIPVKAGTIVTDNHITIDLGKAEILLLNLEGCVEAILKGQYIEDRLMEEVIEALPNKDNLSQEEKIVYGQQIAEVIEKKRNLDTQLITKVLDQNKARDYELRSVDGFDLCNISILMLREEMDEFEQIFRDLVENQLANVRFEFIAPLPIYSFIED